MKKCALLALIAIFAMSLVANAGLVMSLVPEGYSYDAGTTTLTLDAPATVVFDVYATLTGSDGSSLNELMQTIMGGFSSTGTLGASFTAYTYDSVFNQSTAAVSNTGSVIGATTPATAGYLTYRASAYQSNSTGVFKLGTLTYNVTGAEGLNTLSYLLPVKAVGSATFKIDGSSKTGSSGYALISGIDTKVQVIPEPSTLVLLGLGGLALLFIRRK